MAQKFYTDLDAQSANKVINLPTPTNSGDAATKGYVDSAVEGLAWKDSCRVSSAASNINLASPGATIDGVTMASQDRVLVRSQTTASQNGIYVWNGASTPMTRALDANTFAELEQAVVSVEEGTDANTTFRQTAVNGTLETTSVTFVSFGTSAPTATESTAGITLLATQAKTDAGTDDASAVTPLKLKNWSGAPKRFAATFGDGSATSYTITHNLNTRDVVVNVFPTSGQYDNIICDVQRPTVNSVVLVVTPAPASNSLRAVIVG